MTETVLQRLVAEDSVEQMITDLEKIQSIPDEEYDAEQHEIAVSFKREDSHTFFLFL